MQHILPNGIKIQKFLQKKVERPSCFCQKENATSQLAITQEMVQHGLVALMLMLPLGLRPCANI